MSHRARLQLAIVVTGFFFVVELAAGFLTGSLSLLTDAGHMLTDAGALAFSLFAVWLKEKPATSNRTFGYQRTEVLVALGNGLVLWTAVGIIAREAVLRFIHPQPVIVGPMMIIAGLGLIANLLNMALLKKSGEKNLNLQSAYLHVLSDSWGSAGALAAGAVIYKTGWLRIDPLVSLLICGLILRSSWGLVKNSLQVLMEAAPPRLNLEEIHQALKQLHGVVDVHDLHVWTITSGFDALSGHLTVGNIQQSPAILKSAQRLLLEKYSIRHITIQIEEGLLRPR